MANQIKTRALVAAFGMLIACGQSTDNGSSTAQAGTSAGGGGATSAAGGAATAGGGSAGTADAVSGSGGVPSAGAGGQAVSAGSGGEPSAGASGVAGAGGGAAGTGGAAGAAGAAGSAGAAGAAGMDGVGCAGAALCWDFEEGAIPNGWAMIRPMDFNGTLLVDNTQPHSGTYSLHMADLSGGTVGQAGGPKKSMQYTLPENFGPILWGRAYVYTTPHRPMSHAGFFNARYPRPNSVDTAWESLDWYEVAVYQENYMSIWHPPEPPGFPEWVKVSDTPLVLDAWTCVEWLFDGANGAELIPADPRVWIDGTELTWPTEFTFDNTGTDKPERPALEKAANFTMIETGVVMYQGLEVVSNWWIDDLAIGPDRIGCN